MHRSYRATTRLHTGLLLVACAFPFATPAASEPQALLEELIVTARKREQNLQDVPVGVSLLSGDAVARAALRNAGELATLLPTLNVQASSGPSTSSFNIRGIGTQAFSPGVDPSVSTMLDGVVLGRSGMAFMELADIERVEVLRGPQGTLYGKNASGGVVHMITRDPTTELSGTLAATAIEQDEYRIDGTVSAALTDSLSFRLTGSAVNDDGYAENAFNGNKVNDTESYLVRGKLLWQPRDDLELLFSADYSESDCDCYALGVRSILESSQQEALLAEQLPVVPSNSNQDVNIDYEVFTDIESGGLSLTANWELGEYLLTSISAYRDWDSESIVDLDIRPTNVLALTFPKAPNTDQNQFSQEIRLLSPTADWGSYVLGLYYFEQDIDSGNIATTALLEPILPAVTRVSDTSVDGTNAAVFGEMNINLTSHWQLILGGRYTYDELDYDTTAVGSGIIFPPDGEYSDSLDESDFSPKVALQWDVNQQVMMYASYVSGYKGPAFDTGLVAGGTEVDPETSDAWEMGLKSSWLDSRLIINLTAFYAEYQDFQAQTTIDDNPDDLLPGSFVLINAGEVSTQGVELEFIAHPTDNWLVSGGIAYTDGTIDDYPNGNCSSGQKFRGECRSDGTQDLSGGQLPYTPEWKATLATNYTIKLTQMEADIILGANARIQDDVLYELSQDEYTWQDAYGLLDLRAAIAGRERGYRITGFVKNVFDKNYVSLIYAQGEQLIPNGYIHRVPKYAERTAGVELRYDF